MAITCKQCRAAGEKLFGKGEKCTAPSCPLNKRASSLGQRGSNSGRRRVSQYGEQLREKQKVKRIYGIREKQFRNYYDKAAKSQIITGEALLGLLEKRLDNIVFRLGFATSRVQARQLVSHAHVQVNSKKVNIPSYSVKVGDVISLSPKFQKATAFLEIKEALKSHKPVSWLELNASKAEGKVNSEPQRQDTDQNINESLIVEFYSR